MNKERKRNTEVFSYFDSFLFRDIISREVEQSSLHGHVVIREADLLPGPDWWRMLELFMHIFKLTYPTPDSIIFLCMKFIILKSGLFLIIISKNNNSCSLVSITTPNVIIF
jgi:hypothetical protein